MLENGKTSDYTKQSEANDLDSSHSDIKQAVDKSKKVNISQKEKEAKVEHILRDANCLKERKNNNKYSKQFKCEKCDKRYTWYSGLSNHKRFVYDKLK